MPRRRSGRMPLLLKVAGVAGGPAAINSENVAVHVTVLGVREKQCPDGDFIDGTGAAQWDVIEDPLDLFTEFSSFTVEKLLRPVCQRRTGGDAVHQNSMRPQLERHSLREIDDAGLGGNEGTLQA